MDTDTEGACDDRGKTRHEADVNGDGKPDLIELRSLPTPDRRPLARCRRIDLDYDGDTDVTEFYNRDGARVRTETDLNGDGKVDVTAFYNASGAKIRTESDLNSDGTIDAVVTYDPISGAKLSTKLLK